ncbi:MAG: threonine-phosphate decarboxylase CobD [Sedimenticola sp.]
MLEHGGRLRQAAEKYQIPLEQWLDISTGINPNGWPVPSVPASAWLRLPENGDGLEHAAFEYYGCSSLLPVAGSQAAIQLLPQLRPLSKVGILTPGYSEHAHAWKRAGHRLITLDAREIADAIDDLDVLLLCRPNNPDGLVLDSEILLQWHQRLMEKGGWLIIDEAFIDATPELSLSPRGGKKGLIILRSLGKFFGLAGARVGFVLAEQRLLAQLQERLGPWSLAGPSRWVATQALSDRKWQAQTCESLKNSGERLNQLMVQHNLTPLGGTALYQLVEIEQAEALYVQLAQQGILLRLFKEQSAVRFGLPKEEVEWQRLEAALGVCRL